MTASRQLRVIDDCTPTSTKKTAAKKTTAKRTTKRAAKKAPTVAEAAATGDTRQILISLRDHLAVAISSPTTAARDLASLSLRLLNVQAELAGLEAQYAKEAAENGAAYEDEAWDPQAI